MSNNSSKPNLEREIRTIDIEHERGENVVELLFWFRGWNPYLFHQKKLKFDSPRKLFKKALQ